MNLLLDLDSDDENILGNRYVFIGDGLSSDNTPERVYPDANSHSNYNLLTEDTHSIDSWSKNIRESFQAANSHRNTIFETNSHSKYDVHSDTSGSKNLEVSSHSVANSHETYRILTSDSSGKTPADTEDVSQENLIPKDDDGIPGYEVANSHSNYQIFYDSQTRCENFGVGQNLNACSPARSDSSRSSRSTEETSTTCDIEECLVQIEESLLNIEQNLLHVQDLDIPELKNLLYKSPSIDRSLFEVQDLLCTENLESVKRGQLFSFNDNLLDVTDRESTFTDDNLLQFSDEKEGEILEDTEKTLNSMFYGSDERNVNFIPNSLGRTPTKGGFRGADNIKSYSFDGERLRSLNADVINDNLDSKINEKKLLNRKKCHSRTNSLDENFEPVTRRKTSLESIRNKDHLEGNLKAKSDDTLDNKSSYNGDMRKPDSRRSTRVRKSRENRLAEVEAKTDEFRRKIESIISNRKSIIPNLDNSQEKSPRLRKSSLQEKEHSPTSRQFKSNSFDKRKRKKTSRMQTGENAALVPSKLISLSLSLLLAALLQAVRCLTDLVEDAFRSVSYDRNGLLE